MAGASSSSSGLWTYDVFISFRGEDTRRTFVSHLYKALDQKAINTFLDSEELRKGNDLSALFTAIQESRLSIIVFSQNYASSTWCLKELVNIMKCMDAENQIVLPIFYDVDPSDIRKLKRSFAEAFAEHELVSNADKEEMERWRSALTRAAGLSGWVSRDYQNDAKLIEKIVEETSDRLNQISSIQANGFVGMDLVMDQMDLLLCLDHADAVRVLGIWGMGGIGKTTIARAVYEKIACKFKHCCFLENVKEGFMRKGSVQMQEELLSTILKEKVRSLGTLNRGSKMIMERLSKKKVLLVLDDVDNISQIEALLGEPHSFGVGSRIIITTRDKQLLNGVDDIYSPKCLGSDEALDLFQQHAFKTNQPTTEYDNLSRCAIEYTRGLPLALKVLGTFLDNKCVHEWEEVLEKIKKIPHMGIQGVLKTSFDGLDVSEKDIFLDVACFFRGMEKDFVTKLLDGFGFFPRIGLRVLVDRALVTISAHKTLQMHDLLQEMGRDVVCQDSIKDPGRRSRVWRYEDVNHVLTENTGTEAVEGIILDLRNSNELYLNSEAFVGLKKLRLLMIDYIWTIDSDDDDIDPDDDDGIYPLDKDLCYPVDECEQHVIGDLTFLSHELRCFIWHGYPLKSLPSNFYPKNLVYLDMRNSHIEQLWEGTKPLPKLKFVDLSHSQCLNKMSNFTEAANLEILRLEGCLSLLEVHPSVSALNNLVSLNLRRCRELKTLPSSIYMKSLKTLTLSGCSKLERFPEIPEVMKELSELYLDGTTIKELSSSINNLTGLVTLNLGGCGALEILPSSIYMKSLKTLNLSGCSKLERFPEIPEVMKELSELYLDGTAIKELSSSINNLTGLVTLNLRRCRELKTLPSSIYMKSLKTLTLSGCSKLERFPEIPEVMKELSELYLDATAIKELSSSINNLTELVTLSLRGCGALEILPSSIYMKSLKTLNLSGCSKLERFPEIPEVMKELSELYLDGTTIKELSSSINNLTGLVTLNLRRCRELKTLPSSIYMKSLKNLNLSGCSKLERFPEIPEVMKELSELYLDGTAIKELSSSINNLTGLVTLNLRRCRELKTLPSSIYMKSLKTLNLSGCSNLVKFPETPEVMLEISELYLDETAIKELSSSINNLTGLVTLSLKGCGALKILPSIHMRCLKTLDLSGCSNLEKFPKISGLMEQVTELCLDEAAIEELHSSVDLSEDISGVRCKGMTATFSPCSSSNLEICSYSVLVLLDLSDCNLMELSDGIAYLSSLKTLKLCRNSLEILPSTMNQLHCLEDLSLEACKGLKSIPELSSSVSYIGAHDCSALETVSTPKYEFDRKHCLPSKICFTFSNCHRLIQYPFTEIVETHSRYQGQMVTLFYDMCVPGSKIPDWFSHQCKGCTVLVQLLPNLFSGFAICAVSRFEGVPNYANLRSVECFCTLKGKHGEDSFNFHLRDRPFITRKGLDWLESDHMFMGYMSCNQFYMMTKQKPRWAWEVNPKVRDPDYTEASFKVVVVLEVDGVAYTESSWIRSCGVRFLDFH